MRNIVLRSAVLVALLSACATAEAQEVYVNVAENLMTTARPQKKLVLEPRRFQAFDIGILWETSDTEAAGLFSFPRIGVGFSYANLGSLACVPGSRMGDSFTLYIHLDRTFLQLGSFSAGYDLEFGPALMTHYYDRVTNPQNRLYGGPYTNHTKLGFYGRIQASRDLAIKAELNYRHNSTGRLIIPNSGVNSLSLGLGVHYAVGDNTLKPGAHRPEADPLEKRFRVSVFASGGVHCCMAEFRADEKLPPEQRQDSYTPWFKGSVGADVIWRYSRRTATGAQTELFYYANTEALRRSDEILFGPGDRKYSPFAAGIGLLQELYFGSVTMGVGVGAYLFKQVGQHEDHGRLYQKIYLRYYPPALKHLFAGAAIRVHEFQQADYIDFTLGVVL